MEFYKDTVIYCYSCRKKTVFTCKDTHEKRVLIVIAVNVQVFGLNGKIELWKEKWKSGLHIIKS